MAVGAAASLNPTCSCAPCSRAVLPKETANGSLGARRAEARAEAGKGPWGPGGADGGKELRGAGAWCEGVGGLRARAEKGEASEKMPACKKYTKGWKAGENLKGGLRE